MVAAAPSPVYILRNPPPPPPLDPNPAGSYLLPGQFNVVVNPILVIFFLVLIIFGISKVRQRWIARRNAATAAAVGSMPPVDLQPVGDTGLLLDPSRAPGGFPPETMDALGTPFKFQADAASAVSDEEDARKECIVCLGEYRDEELLRKLHMCGHTFHKECVDAWLTTHKSCPLCRTTLVLPGSSAPGAGAYGGCPAAGAGTVPVETFSLAQDELGHR